MDEYRNMKTQFSDSEEAYLVSRTVFVSECGGHRQLWTVFFAELVSAVAV
jgi:hypothetical protein